MVSFVSVANGPFLGSSGRLVDCEPPILTASTVQFSCSTRGADIPGAQWLRRAGHSDIRCRGSWDNDRSTFKMSCF